MINSISLEPEKFEKLIPVARKYGAMFILLPLSEAGLPKDIDEKKEIIHTILERAYEFGLTKDDVVVDGLVATIGANRNAAKETMETISYCKNDIGVATACGLSNISFGLPERMFVNSSFMSIAISHGLTMAIANPSQDLLMHSMFAADLLMNKPESDTRYINRVTGRKLSVLSGDIDASQVTAQAGNTASASDIDSDVITARSLLSRLENAETFSIFTRQSEQEQPEATISFYVAECMEFPVMGEYHNNLTLEEAIKIYESIPAERLHGIKGIGFDLQDGDEDYSGEYGLMSGDRIERDLIDLIPHYKESPLVQKAINDMEKYLNEKHGKVQEAEQTVEVKQEVSETPFKKESVSVEPNREQNKEPAKGGKGELKKSVLQSLKEFQARAKAQEQKEMATEKSKAHKKGNVEL